jgi:hypothetical protein
MDNDAGTTVKEELAIECGRRMSSNYYVKVKKYMQKTVPLQKVIDDLYTHDILNYKLGEIYTVNNNKIYILAI